jgi:catechol 2,3-dioxygenase-like lactoylglutathione lyase family enzyme
MIRYPVGASEVKLFPVEPSAVGVPGAASRIEDVAGVRLLTFFFADQAALTGRFAAHRLPAPRFLPASSPAGATARALVQDPDGEWVELVVVPGASGEQLARFEIGVTVNDLAASRAFYGELLGLAPQPPVRDDLVGAVKHAFTHGATTINLWSFDAELPRDSETAGMQYIVWNVAAIDAVVRERDRPAAVAAGANADAVAPGSGRRQQLLRRVRRQRQPRCPY